MKLEELVNLLDAQIFTQINYNPKKDVNFAFSCDLMSDALMLLRNVPLSFCEEGVLVTGLVNMQGIRTAEMLDLKIILITRSKKPTEQIIKLSEDLGITLIGTDYTMFSTSGRMYGVGIKGISELNEN